MAHEQDRASDRLDPEALNSPLAKMFAPERSLPDPLPADPLPIVRDWFEYAASNRVQPNPNAMTLATVRDDGLPEARIVLCKSLDADSGLVTFYTNYRSAKAKALEANPHAGVLFHWDTLDVQIRIEGPVARCPEDESDAYFRSRPWASRLGAWASEQSRPLDRREALLEQVLEAAARFGIDPNNPPQGDNPGPEIPRPAHWGGYRLCAARVEVWLGGPGRVHDRAGWSRSVTPDSGGDGFDRGPWAAGRLQP